MASGLIRPDAIRKNQAKLTLEQLHAELAGKLIGSQAEAKRLTLAMLQVEAVLKMLDPDYSVRGISIRRRKLNKLFKRGTVHRTALGVLRAASEPMTSRQIAQRMLTDKGAEPDRRAVRELASAVQASMRNNRGKTVRDVAQGMPARWEITCP